MQKKTYGKKAKNVFGLAAVCAVVAAFLHVFLGLARTDQVDRYLSGYGDNRFGWEYEILSDGRAEKITPEFDEYGYVRYPTDRPQAVKIARTMTETIPDAELELEIYTGKAVEVFLDDMPLYSDFIGGERSKEGYLLLDDQTVRSTAEHTETYRFGKRVRVSLPDDYTGRRLTIVTYFLETFEEYLPCYPSLGTLTSRFALDVACAVMPVATLVLCAICVVLLMLVFLMDFSNGQKDWKILLFILYFILLFLNVRYSYTLGSLDGAGKMTEMTEMFSAAEVCMIPLLLYLALLLSGWRRWLALCGMAVWAVYEGICTWTSVRSGIFMLGDWTGIGSFFLVLFFMAAFLLEYFLAGRWRSGGRWNLLYAMLTVFVAAVCVIYEANRVYSGNVAEYFQTMFGLIRDGYFQTLVALVQNVCAAMAMILLVSQFLRRNAETRAMVAVLEERQRASMEGYDRMLRAEEAVNAACHEMRHHTTALMALLQNNEAKRACEYLSSIEKTLEQMPVFKYSRNMLVNVIAGTYLDRAKEQGIRVECTVCVPEELKVADEDISVFLSNMLQNAVEACERMDPGADRYIRFKMYQKDHFLFVGCINSYPREEKDQTPDGSGREHREHGYGMEAMRRIAEKYGSILKVDRRDGDFSVMSNLCLEGES